MATSENETKQRQNRWVWVILGGLTAVSLFICIGLAGFAIGRTSATAETVTETITEMVEVTRQVPVTVVMESSTTDTDAAETGSEPDASVSEEAAGEGEATLPDPTPPPTAAPATAAAETDEIDFDLFYEAWDIIEEDFDGEIPANEELLYAAIEGSIEALDDEFTSFIEPDVAARLREDMGGSVSGIGAFVQENDDGLLEIVAPIEGQPADRAGLQAGDVVVGIDGESVLDLSFDETILLIRGPSDTEVTLMVRRPDEAELLEFTIVRTRFEVPVVESEMLPENIAYIRLIDFTSNADERLETAVVELLAQNPEGMILDLRNNPGGFLSVTIRIADLFLPESVILYERNRSGLDETFMAEDGDIAEEIPLVVLVNEASASASEIVAGAVKDNGRGILIGATTFGKGSVQTVHELSNGAELRVTIARWYTPGNNSIDAEGVTPNIEVETPEELGGEDDGQLQRAIEYILNGE